jgi:pseudouridine-5'-phosphate glycosidase
MMAGKTVLQVSTDVAEALADGKPVVALESTIITHGMPWPQNMETALAVEQTVRDGGAMPATIAVSDGVVNIGLSQSQLERLAKAKDVMKLSRADMAFALATGRVGSTTVAATMMAAELAGIEVFATGGIGGVHKGAETSFDISADLTELGRTNTIVVCAGAKAILDVEKTLEVLETQGVPVVGFGCDSLPGFWSRQSSFNLSLRMDTPAEIAALWQARAAIGQVGGVLVANPVPQTDEIPQLEMADYIEQAVKDAAKAAISGKAVTPWLLSRIVEITGGRSLKTNIALIKNNARLAAEIAVALAG